MARKKKTRRQTLRKQCEQLCREIVFNRDWHRCVRCGADERTAFKLDWSHLIRRSRCTRLICDPDNSVVHCRDCHHFHGLNEGLSMLEIGANRPQRCLRLLEKYQAAVAESRRNAHIPIAFWEQQLLELQRLHKSS